MKEMLKGPAIIYYLVKQLKEKYPDKQVGKTVIQKLMYLFESKSNGDFEFTMYHYGPYSSKVGEYVNIAEVLGLIKTEWKPEKGYSIKPSDSADFSDEITSDEKKIIDELVNKYGAFSAVELSIIATAFYVKNNFEVNDAHQIVKTVLSLKPNNRKEWVENILRNAGVIDASN